MAKKKIHKYKVGDTMRFRFFCGTVYTGTVAELRYSGDNWDHTETNFGDPQYVIHVPDTSGRYSRGYMVYSNISDHRIISVNGDLKEPIFPEPGKMVDRIEKCPIPGIDAIGISIPKKDELQEAINKQKEFIDGKVKN